MARLDSDARACLSMAASELSIPQGRSAPGAGYPVLACGAWLKNAACLSGPDGTDWSVIHGDLGDPAARIALQHSLERLISAVSGRIRAIAHDLHPDFYSTELAIDLAARLDIPAIGVQHHHAHIGAVIAAHQIERPVIGLALDGVGLGTDGTAWGGELLWVDGPQWARLGHLMPMALPGGDRAAVEPWRMAASALHLLGRGDQIAARFADVVGEPVARGVAQMLVKGINCPMSSSAGRWFDAAAGALGISVRQTEEAQAAQALEQLAHEWLSQQTGQTGPDGIDITADNQLDARGIFRVLLDTPAEQRGRRAAQFHLALADRLVQWVANACRDRQVDIVCLGGGCFYNRLIRERVVGALEVKGLQVFLPGHYGCGDAGLALGQAWVARQQLDAAGVPERKGSELCV